MTSFLQPLLREGVAAQRIENLRNGRIVASHVIAAFDSASRRTGLLQHKGFAEGSALIIAPSNAIHTFFMKFPIDLAFFSKSGRVVKVCAAVPAWRLAGALRAFGVIELPAGSLARSDTRTGDQLVIAPFDTGRVDV